MAARADGLSITYQGVSCLPAFQVSRPTGLEPGFGFVGLDVADLKGKFAIEPSLPGVNAPPLAASSTPSVPGGSTSRDAPPPSPVGPPADGGLRSAGDLVVSERLGSGIFWATTFKGMLITERGIETVKAVDGGSRFAKVEIADIRYLWGLRGLLCKWVNVPKIAAGQAPPGTSTTSDRAIPPMQEGSLDEGGKPWTLRRTLELVVLPKLPGAPKLKRLPPDLEGDKAIPIDHPWDGVLPKRALGELLAEFGLILSLNLDGSVSLWHPGEGRVTLDDANSTPIKYATGEKEEFVSWAKDLVTPHYIPALVVVLGPPIRETTRIFLEPVGESRLTGDLIPLGDALQELGVTTRLARSWVLAPEDERALLDLPSDVVEELERWAFKWFRIPGGAAVRADWLPIRDRGTIDSAGVLVAPRVWSEGLARLNAAAIAKLVTGGTLSPGTQVSDSIKALASAAKTKALACFVNLPWGVATDGYEIDHVRGLVKFRSIQVRAADGSVPPGAPEPRSSAPASQGGGLLSAEDVANALGGAATSAGVPSKPLDWRKALRTLGAFLIGPIVQYAVDSEAALSQAKAVAAASLATKAKGPAQSVPATGGGALFNAYVDRPAFVQLEWGWDLKPGALDDLSLSHRYVSFWARIPGKNGQPPKVEQASSLAPSVAPLTIHRPDLLEVHDADGATNKPQLDAIAKKLATAELSRDEVTTGSTIQLHRPAPVATNGLVTTTVYSTSRARPRVMIHVGSFAPLSSPHPQTHARAPQKPSIHDSVIVPRSVQ